MTSRMTRPLALRLWWIVLAGLVLAGWVAAATASSLDDRAAPGALVPVGGGAALLAGLAVALALCHALKRAAADLAVAAALAMSGERLAQSSLAVCELLAVGDALHAAAARATASRLAAGGDANQAA